MAKRYKAPTIKELQASIRTSFDCWNNLRRKGGVDPFFADGMNMNLVRNHIFYDQNQLRETCKNQKVKKCPKEAKRKPPRLVSNDYCAPKSKAGPCRERRKRSVTK